MPIRELQTVAPDRDPIRRETSTTTHGWRRLAALLAASVLLSSATLSATAKDGGGGGGSSGGGGGANSGNSASQSTLMQIEGTVTSMPAGGALIGLWTIAGVTVRTDAATKIEQEQGAVGIGAEVEVKGSAQSDGTVLAIALEVSVGVPASQPGTPSSDPGAGQAVIPTSDEVEVEGLIDALPAGGALIGTWQIGGRPVIVTATTILDAEHGAFEVGASVEARGQRDATGTLVAQRIERSDGLGAAVPALLFWGAIEALPAAPSGLIGLWNVAGRAVNVTAATEIKLEAGPIVVGAIVAVRGFVQADGHVDAHEIETRSAIGDVPGQGMQAVEFYDDHGRYVLSADPAQIARFDHRGPDGSWRRTGESFVVGGSTAVCSFNATGDDASSPLLSADAAECRDMMRRDPDWQFDDHPFSITPATDGQCPAGMIGVHRLYRLSGHGNAILHRYLTTQQTIDAAVTAGWIDEGVTMCAPA